MDIKSLSVTVDAYQDTRKLRLAEEKIAAATKVVENALKEEILAALRTEEVTGIGGTTHFAQRKETDEPHAEDWDAIHEYIVENDAWELMHKQLTSSAVKERWDAGEQVPGVGSYPVEKLSLTKL